LSGNWSAYLNSYLENPIDNDVEFRDLVFREAHKKDFLFFESKVSHGN